MGLADSRPPQRYRSEVLRFGCGLVAFIIGSVIVEVPLDERSEGLIILIAWSLGAAVAVALYTVLRTGLEAPPVDATGSAGPEE